MLAAEECAGDRGPDEKAVVAYTAFLCARLLEVSREERAAHTVQRAWRLWRATKPGGRNLLGFRLRLIALHHQVGMILNLICLSIRVQANHLLLQALRGRICTGGSQQQASFRKHGNLVSSAGGSGWGPKSASISWQLWCGCKHAGGGGPCAQPSCRPAPPPLSCRWEDLEILIVSTGL